MLEASNYILPIIAIFIILYGFFNKTDIYTSFLKGTIEGFKVLYDIAPTVITMVFAIEIFLKSNIINYLMRRTFFLAPEVFSMMILRPISGNATLGIMQNIFTKYGPDSFNGIIASLLQGSTETTVYVIALYYGTVKIKKIGNTLKIGLIVDLVGIILGLILGYYFFL